MLYLLLSRVTQENKGKRKGKDQGKEREREGVFLHREMNNLHKEACRISLPIGVS